MRNRFRWGLVAWAVFGAAALAQAQTPSLYPDRPIRLVIAFPPGGATDTLSRQVTQELGEALGQSVVIENKPGAGGYIAWNYVAAADPDGYTLLMAENALGISQALYKKTSSSFDPVKQYDAIAVVATSPLVLAVANNVKANSVNELIAYARAMPQKINYASAGIGSVSHLTFEVIRAGTGMDAVHVPYKGGAPAAAALAAGDIPLGVLASSSVAPHVKSGRVRVLAVTMGKRSPLNPEWPTLQEQGVKEVDASNWTALFAPKATPQPVIDKLNAEVVKILHMPDVKQRFAGGGVDTIPSSAAELDARVKQEAERFRAIVHKANIRPD